MHLLPFLLRIYVQGKLVYTCKNFAPAFMHFIDFFFIIYLFFIDLLVDFECCIYDCRADAEFYDFGFVKSRLHY